MRAIGCVILSLVLCSFAASAFADDQLTNSQKRSYLRGRVSAERVDRLTDSQLDALYEYYRSGKADEDQRKAEALDSGIETQRALRAAAARAYQQRLAAQRGRTGYAPVITTLPSGASLAAGAVISPDGRYVRINASPFFSSVPGFYTFNMANGQTQYYPIPQDQYGNALPNSPLLPQPGNQLPRPALQGVIPRPALEGYIPRPALQPR